LEKLENEEFELMATIARRIWLYRSIVVFGGDLTYPTQIIRSVKESVEEFYKAKQNAKNIVEYNLDPLVPKWMVLE
jgi:hypothetical protein